MRSQVEQNTTLKKSRLFYIHKDLMPEVLLQWSQLRRVKRETPSLSTYINQLIKSALQREQVLNKMLPNLNFVGIVENDMVIHDISDDQMYRVKREDGTIRCIQDDSNNCKHVMFAMSTSEITQLYTDFHISGETASDHKTVRATILQREHAINESPRKFNARRNKILTKPKTSI